MKHSTLVALMILAFLGVCQTQAHFIEDDIDEASGDGPGIPDNGFGDDEDFDTEGSGILNGDDVEIATTTVTLINRAGDNYTLSAYDIYSVYEEEGELVTELSNEVLVPSIQIMRHAQFGLTGASES